MFKVIVVDGSAWVVVVAPVIVLLKFRIGELVPSEEVLFVKKILVSLNECALLIRFVKDSYGKIYSS